MSSNSPPKEPDVEQTQSGEEQDQMDREQEGQTGGGLGDFEVKEQDRWLPIANGWLRFICAPVSVQHDLFVPCVTCCEFAWWNRLCANPERPTNAGTLMRHILPIRCVSSPPVMICISALVSLARVVLLNVKNKSCLLTIRQRPRRARTARQDLHNFWQHPMLTSAILLQLPVL